MFTLNILTPYHTCSKNLTRSFNYLFMYLILLDERHSVTSLITPRSALGPHCVLRLQINTVSANKPGSFTKVYNAHLAFFCFFVCFFVGWEGVVLFLKQ